MNAQRRLSSYVIALLLFAGCLFPGPSASAETLADVDAEIQLNKTLVRVPGQDAYNVYAGVNNALLDRKIAILNASGITKFASTGSYSNFYSFTGLAGVTDTQLSVVTTTSTQRLYRLGNTSRKESQTYLGAWWGNQYRGVNRTRSEEAVLAAWPGDLQRIYVMDMPAGVSMVSGLTSPMEKNGEYQPGGAVQNYYYGAPSSWLVYALYMPDYLESYAAALTGAQKLGRNSLEDIGGHLSDLRYQGTTQDSNIWLRLYGGNTQYTANGGDFNANSNGIHGGWDRLIKGGKMGEADRMHIGALVGQGTFNQNDAVSGVKNDITNTYAGIYSLYQSHPDASRSWYGSAIATYGKLDLSNQVPGESAGLGLVQKYGGNLLAASLENGLTFRQKNGWFIEPQAQLLYTKFLQGAFNDNLGATISLRGNESLLGRIGIMALRKMQNKAGQQTKFWARASYLREFCGANSLDVAGDSAQSNNGRNYYQINAGANVDITRHLSLNGDVSKTFGDEQGYRFSLLLTNAW